MQGITATTTKNNNKTPLVAWKHSQELFPEAARPGRCAGADGGKQRAWSPCPFCTGAARPQLSGGGEQCAPGWGWGLAGSRWPCAVGPGTPAWAVTGGPAWQPESRCHHREGPRAAGEAPWPGEGQECRFVCVTLFLLSLQRSPVLQSNREGKETGFRQRNRKLAKSIRLLGSKVNGRIFLYVLVFMKGENTGFY